MTRRMFAKQIAAVVSTLRLVGCDPYDQLTGYLGTGNLAFITRTNGARDIVRRMDPQMIRQYLEAHR